MLYCNLLVLFHCFHCRSRPIRCGVKSYALTRENIFIKYVLCYNLLASILKSGVHSITALYSCDIVSISISEIYIIFPWKGESVIYIMLHYSTIVSEKIIQFLHINLACTLVKNLECVPVVQVLFAHPGAFCTSCAACYH